MTDYPVASDLSYLVLQKRRRKGELTTPQLDSVNKTLYPLPCAIVQREAFIADRPGGVSEAEWHLERQRRKLIG